MLCLFLSLRDVADAEEFEELPELDTDESSVLDDSELDVELDASELSDGGGEGSGGLCSLESWDDMELSSQVILE